MKKHFISFVLLLALLFPVVTLAQSDSYTAEFKVYNASKGNVDATAMPANLGDVLMYQITMQGHSSVSSEPVRVDMSKAGDVTVVDFGEGRRQGDIILLPTVSDENSNWQRTFSFQTRIPADMEQDATSMSYNGMVRTVQIDRNMAETTPSTGPASSIAVGIGVVLLLIGTIVISRRRSA